jgi:hypothetical protein
MSLSLNDHGTVHFRCDIPDGIRVVGRFDQINFVSQSLSGHYRQSKVLIIDLPPCLCVFLKSQRIPIVDCEIAVLRSLRYCHCPWS